MNLIDTALPDVKIIEPVVHGDERGFFFESWNEAQFNEALGKSTRFVQDNHSRSSFGVLRGMHYQLVKPQGKLVRAPVGRVLDVAVDLRRSSDSFGEWVAVELSADNRLQLWVPPGFGHGFTVLSDYAELVYKTTDYYYPAGDRALAWNDPEIGIDWQLSGAPILSDKDRNAPKLTDVELFE